MPLDEVRRAPDRRALQRPGAHEGLVEQVFVVAAGGRQAVDLAAVPAIQPRPAVHGRAPALRHFREDIDPRPQVFAPLGVVGGGGHERAGPLGQALAVLVMELADGAGAAVGVAAHLVQRGQRKVAVKSGVFNPLGHQGAGDLLEAADEQLPFAAARLVQLRRLLQEQHVADEVEHGGVAGRVPPLGLRHRTLDHLPVAVGNAALVDVRPIDRKAGQNLAQRDPQTVEREVARAAVPLRNAIDPMGQQ